jgi:hypothetical protein
MVELSYKCYWKVKLLPRGNPTPSEYIKSNLSSKDIKKLNEKFTALERIRYPKDFIDSKSFRHNNTLLRQFSFEGHRMYFYVDTKNSRNYIVFCYVCLKKGQDAREEDLDKAAYYINLYKESNGE